MSILDLRLRVANIAREAEGVLSFHLQALDGSDLPSWSPGAHLDIHLPSGVERQYSLCGSPADRKAWRIAVLREQDGRGGSREIHDQISVGDVVTVAGPRNNFDFVASDRYIFIAGGIGITPILPMIEHAIAAGANWTLAYGGRSRESMSFAGQLAALGDSVLIHPQDEEGLLDLPTILGEVRDDTLIYCCGPEALLAAVEKLCVTWPMDSLRVERFSAKPQEVDPRGDSSFQVIAKQSGIAVEVPDGTSILEALEEAGLAPEYSCREGVCGTCEVDVVEGLPDHRDSILSESERAANRTMMICVGRALSQQLVLDL